MRRYSSVIGIQARARQVAVVCGVLAIGALASALFGYESMKRAQQAEAQAQNTRKLAESARSEAEKLIVYLLDDFYLELEPVGRLDIVAQLSKRALDYYSALPPELRKPGPPPPSPLSTRLPAYPGMLVAG